MLPQRGGRPVCQALRFLRQSQMSPDELLAEHADSFSIPVGEIRQARGRSDSDDDNAGETLEIKTGSGKIELTLARGGGRSVREALRQVLGERVR